MAGKLLDEEAEVYSEKYDVHGTVRDYGFVTKLSFLYGGREITIAIHRNVLKRERLEDAGRDVMESYIENLSTDRRKLMLHYWYIEETEYEGRRFGIGQGIVTGHPKLPDSIDMHTSEVKSVYVDEEAAGVVITTRNSVYHCPLAYCDFDEQDRYPDFIPDYERIKEKYKDTIEYPSIEPGKVLLVLADFSEYYFHSVYYVPADAEDRKPLPFSGHPHIGTFQDSYLIHVKSTPIDLRYFPHYQNIEFYSEDTNDMPLYLENIGEAVLYVGTSCGTIRLGPGERKEVSKDNAEKEKPILPRGDLYPAGIIE